LMKTRGMNADDDLADFTVKTITTESIE
jgi:hypothetical protein